MVPEYFEPLSSDDCILLTRINLCVAAAGLLLFALLVDSGEHDLRALAFLASADATSEVPPRPTPTITGGQGFAPDSKMHCRTNL